MCALSFSHHKTQSVTHQRAGSLSHGGNRDIWSSFQLNEGDKTNTYDEDTESF